MAKTHLQWFNLGYSTHRTAWCSRRKRPIYRYSASPGRASFFSAAFV